MKTIIKKLHRLICRYCGRDIDAIGQDNMSSTLGAPMCEDCYNDGR